MTTKNAQPNHDSQPKTGRVPLRRRWWFWLLVILAVVLLLPVLLVGLVLVALNTETGTAWTIEKIPGLNTKAGNGSLLGQWQAESLEWQGYGVGVLVQSPEVDWSPSCLFELTLCLETLKATRIEVGVQPSESNESDESGAITLPEINLPLALNVRDVDLGPLTVNESAIWDRVELRTSASGASLQIDHAFYKLGGIRVTASGRAEMRRDWPLDINVTAELPPPSGDAWQIGLNLAGSVRQLRVTGQSEGYLDASLNGQVEPLNNSLPANLTVQSPAFLAHDSLPPTLTLNQLVVGLNGSLAKGFAAESSAVLPGTTGEISLALKGVVTTGDVSDLVLSLSGPAASERQQPGTFEARGEVSWSEGLEANAKLNLDAFPWYGLIPGIQPPPVVLEALQGQATYRDGSYDADLGARVSGPLGSANLRTRVNGNLESLSIRQLEMTTGAGSLSGHGELGFSGPLSWQAALELNQFNPGYWLPVLESSLNGQVNSEGELQEGELPAMSADWALQGTWQQQEANAEGRLTSDGSDWLLDDLLLTVGENRVTGSGRYGADIAADFAVLLPQPGALVPGLEGELSAQLTASGNVQKPQATLSLGAQELAWQDLLRVGSAEIQAELAAGEVLDATLAAKSIKASGQDVDEVMLSVNGTRENHQVSLTASHPEVSLLLDFVGSLGVNLASWSGALTRGEIDVPEPGQSWVLDQPADLVYSADGVLSFGAHCWRWQDSSVCAGEQQLWPDPRIAYQITRFPALALEPLFPETFRWTAMLDADIELSYTDAGPDGRISVDAGEGTFEFLVLDKWEKLSHRTLTVDALLKPEQAELSFALSGPELGEFSTRLAVDPISEQRTVDGQFSLKNLDLAFLSAFAGLEEVKGQVNGEGTLAGPLLKPEITGELALTEGRLQDTKLPLPLEEVVLVLEFLGYSADISGRWQSNDRSQGQLSGTLNWQQEPELALNVSGNRLPVNIEPYASVEVAPDLDIRFGSGELAVSGRVEVPRGSIEIKGLPESAVSVSEDEQVVGVQREEPTIRAMLMDITVVVGEEEVGFDAFGLTGNLEGTLRIGNNMDTRGALRLVNGRYEAFGQELDLRRARVVFVGALTEPYLDIEAVREVDTVVAGIRLSGPVSAPETEVFSEPAMPQSDALSYVILGRPPRGRGDEGQMSQAAISLGLTQTSKFTQGIGEELGIKNLILEAEGSGDQAAVVASGYITDELSLRYGVGIFEPITTVALRYDLGRYFYLEAASGLAASLDIFYTRDF
ncbi:translocation/assembly module TamB domain-containing protein [Marinobacter sp. SS5-14b]|uniref:translocation/assembly module TamB domain-containing protein n=1 Tax=Marinobacter sp. SS5-14b TaxID=3050456 RepID=UPI0026DF6509|nr:translocation/assembly module TamB domain-containing protein [Marinobacter sp. SS5-14b]